MPLATTYDPSAPAARTGTGSAIANREDLASAITLLAPQETPVISMAPKLGRAESTFPEWPVDKLAAPNKSGVMEGADISAFPNKFENVARLGNYITILERPWAISDLQEVVKSAGPQDKGRAIAKAIAELKRDIEYKFCSDDDRTAQDGATAYGSRALGDWIDSAGPSDVPAPYRTPSASILGAAPTQLTLDDMVASVWGACGKRGSFDLVAGTALRQVITNFSRFEGTTRTSAFTVTEPASSKTIPFEVTVFQCAYGTVNVINGNPDCLPAATRGYLLQSQYYGIKDLLPLEQKELPDMGGGPRGYVKWSGTLVVKNPRAFGKIAY